MSSGSSSDRKPRTPFAFSTTPYTHHQLPRYISGILTIKDATRSTCSNPNHKQHIAAMPGLVSATGVLGFLSDEEPELKIFALQTLNDDIDTLWTEVAASVGQM